MRGFDMPKIEERKGEMNDVWYHVLECVRIHGRDNASYIEDDDSVGEYFNKDNYSINWEITPGIILSYWYGGDETLRLSFNGRQLRLSSVALTEFYTLTFCLVNARDTVAHSWTPPRRGVYVGFTADFIEQCKIACTKGMFIESAA